MTPGTVARQAPLSMEFSRQEREWVAISSSRGSPQPGDSNPHLLCLRHWQVASVLLSHLGSPLLSRFPLKPTLSLSPFLPASQRLLFAVPPAPASFFISLLEKPFPPIFVHLTLTHLLNLTCIPLFLIFPDSSLGPLIPLPDKM